MIVGGGVHGCAIAYELSKRGIDVVVCERNYLASGSTGRCAGGIRATFSNPDDISMMMECTKLWKNLEEELECEIEYKQGGYLYLLSSESELKEYRGYSRIQNETGLNSRIIGPDEVKEIVPSARFDQGIIGALWGPSDGHANPLLATYAYARAARKLGARICTSTEVIGVKTKNNHISSVTTSKGNIETGTVVIAAGVDSIKIADMVGISLPTKPEKVEALITDPLDELFDSMILWVGNGAFTLQHKRGQIMLGAGYGKWSNESSTLSSDYAFLKETAKLTKYFPAFKHLGIVRHWAGFYNMTPDHRQILGQVDGVEGAILALGWSGHGFMFAPIVSKLIAELIQDDKTSMPLETYSLKRFDKETATSEHMVFGAR